MNYRLKNAIVLSLPVQILLVSWITRYPEVIENYYSLGIYPYISAVLRWLYGWIPFSLGDILYTLLLLVTGRYLYLHWLEIRTKPLSFLRDLLVVFSIAYFSFHLLWGLNYYRQPLSKTLGLRNSYTTEELTAFTAVLTEKTNELQAKLSEADSIQVVVPFKRQEIFEMVSSDYRPLPTEFPEFEYSNPSVKGSLYSLALTYMGYGGYLNPFTLEAQVNQKIPMSRFPVVSCHEIAHQLGYAAENEANFIGYLAALNQGDPRLRYSALSYALGYCLSELRALDEELFEEAYSRVNPGIKKDYEELSAFWKAYENPLEPIFKLTFNAFLKANNQAAGIRSYNLVVALLVAYHEESPL
ncbi:DUF3810 domain-containing protein [Muriicola marianensis]|nr:DUF3810 domain-containing protein [Muriicola marianensis]